jgi:hypothetical protein
LAFRRGHAARPKSGWSQLHETLSAPIFNPFCIYLLKTNQDDIA